MNEAKSSTNPQYVKAAMLSKSEIIDIVDQADGAVRMARASWFAAKSHLDRDAATEVADAALDRIESVADQLRDLLITRVADRAS